MNKTNFQKFFHILKNYLNVIYNKHENRICIQGVADCLFYDSDGLNFKSNNVVMILTKSDATPQIVRQWIIQGIIAQQHNLGFPKNYLVEDIVELILNAIQKELNELNPVLSLSNAGTYQRMISTYGHIKQEDVSTLSIGTFK